VGIADSDDLALGRRMADKLVSLRYFEDDQGRTNLAINEVNGAMLVVSQFTLLADVRRGRRPGFTAAAAPDVARQLVDAFAARVREAGIPVAEGRFGAAMDVELVNDGPFTLVLDSERDL
jgi:D-tyrosyl-tRNA(Tyr) deacylase